MKCFLSLAIITITLSLTIAAPANEYLNQRARKPSNIEIRKSISYETSVDPLQGKKYDLIPADCHSLGAEVQRIGNKEFKIQKIGCIYPGDSPIPQDVLQAVNEHFRNRIAQYAV